MENNRRTKRIPAQFPIRWIRQPKDIDGVVTNINAHGLFMQTAFEAPIGSLQQLEIDLPDGKLRMFVVVRFVGSTLSGRGIGVEIFVIDQIGAQRWKSLYHGLLAHLTRRPAAELGFLEEARASNSPAANVKNVAVEGSVAARSPALSRTGTLA